MEMSVEKAMDIIREWFERPTHSLPAKLVVDAYQFILKKAKMKQNAQRWLEITLDALKDESSRHRLQDGHYWFICPAEKIDVMIIPSIEMALDKEQSK